MKTNTINNHITFMSDEEAMNHVPMLTNLMVLPEVIDDGVTVYNVDADCTIELVPLLKEAGKEIQALLHRAKIDTDIEDGSVPVLEGEPTNLLNLLTLADVINSDATIYDEDGDATVYLVPMLKEAAEEYEWLQNRISPADSSPDDGGANSATKVVEHMTMGEAVDHLCNLFNLMLLGDRIDAGANVVSLETGEIVELVPLIHEAHNELRWLLERANIDRVAINTPKVGSYGVIRFVDQMVARKREMIDTLAECDRIKAEASKKFGDWLSTAVANATPLEIAEVADYNGDGITRMDKLAVMAGRVFLDVGQVDDKK